MNKKLLIGGITGGVAFFFLGWIIYGMLLMDVMSRMSGSATGVPRSEEEMVWWALVLGNFVWGFFIAWLFGKMGNINGWMDGAMTGATIGFFVGSGFDLIMYATSNVISLNGAIVDIAAFTAMIGIGSAIIAIVMNRK